MLLQRCSHACTWVMRVRDISIEVMAPLSVITYISSYFIAVITDCEQ